MKKIEKKVAVKKVVKKVTKKVAKKSAPKKTKIKDISKDLILASDENSFWLNDGQILNSLSALEKALSVMDKQVYAYHTANDCNDFANWVEDILEDIKCAQDIKKAKTVKSAHSAVVKHLKFYKK